MKHILPILLAFVFLASSCTKDKEQGPAGPEEIILTFEEKEKRASDSLFAIYSLRFEKPLELSSVIVSNHFYGEETDFIYYTALRKGDPWIAIYDKNNRLLKEQTEAFPDSIKHNSNINRLTSYRALQTKDILVIRGIASHIDQPNTSGLTGNVAHYFYYYDISKNDIKMKAISYGEFDKLDISTSSIPLNEWHDGSFIMEGKLGNETYYVITKELEPIDVYKGNHEYSAKKGSYNFHFTWYNNKYYPTSMSEYFEIRTYETNVIVQNKSITSVLIVPEYPSLPYYSYDLDPIIIEAIKKPENFAQLNEQKSSINDLGDKLEVSITGTMLLSDDESKSFYEKEVSGKVYIDKKTGKEIK